MLSYPASVTIVTCVSGSMASISSGRMGRPFIVPLGPGPNVA
jgi:hypothetical protein